MAMNPEFRMSRPACIRRFSAPLSVLVLAVFLAAGGAGAAWFVGPAGDDMAPGTRDLPFATLQFAIDGAAVGDTIIMLDGDYTTPGNVDVSWANKGLVIRSDSGDPDQCRLLCSGGTALRFVNTDPGAVHHLSISGLTVANADTAISASPGGTWSGYPVTNYLNVQSCRLRNGLIGIWVMGTEITLADTYISNFSDRGIGEYRGGFGFDIRRSVFRNNGVGLKFSQYLYYEDSHIDSTQFVANGVGMSTWTEWTAIRISHSSFDSSYAGEGIRLGSDYDPVYINNSSFRFNAGAGIGNYGGGAFLAASACTLSNNGLNGFGSHSMYSNINFTDVVIENNGLWGIGPYVTPTGAEFDAQERHSSRKGRKLISAASRLANCRIAGNDSGGVFLRGDVDIVDFDNVLITDNRGPGLVVTTLRPSLSGYITRTTIAGNAGDGLRTAVNLGLVTNSLIAGNGGAAVVFDGAGTLTMDCCDLYGNLGGDWTAPIIGLFDGIGNVTLDPRFCAADNPLEPWSLSRESPCLDGNNLGCGQVGATLQGCEIPPLITAVTDIGNDQGRQVRVAWLGSGLDAPGSGTVVTGYALYRRQDAWKASSRPGPDGRKLAFWDYLFTVPARQDAAYQAVAPTLCDSTISDGQCFSTFMVSAITADPGTFFDSPPDSGYSVDNLAPGAPGGFVVAYAAGGNTLSWTTPSAPDLKGVRVFRRDLDSGPPAPGTEPTFLATGTSWLDSSLPPGTSAWDHEYWLEAVDKSGNPGPLVAPDGTTAALEQAAAPRTVLHPAAPNPFNPATRLSFDLAADGDVDLRIYDAAGRLVRTLLSGESRIAGRHTIEWNGRDDAGRNVSAGVYYYRMRAGDRVLGGRATLLK
ncbi:right-handed parallel beta-helix repeat-containing protein [bacterium]|nr:right-handed parallel beta-helix repeat-containing protein [bacterium]